VRSVLLVPLYFLIIIKFMTMIIASSAYVIIYMRYIWWTVCRSFLSWFEPQSL